MTTTPLNEPGPPDRIEGRAIDRLTVIAAIAIVVAGVLAYLLRSTPAAAAAIVGPLITIAGGAAASLGTRRTRTEPPPPATIPTTPLDVTPAIVTPLVAPALPDDTVAAAIATAHPAGPAHESAAGHDAATDWTTTLPDETPTNPFAAVTPPPFEGTV